ncbi:MAG: S1-like domain-containing RNA-binding protein [Bacillus subtilis]|nr:S1-like domain-containing RNA-binding protein [Bacillus subtilis]
MILGMMNTLKIVRETDISYLLTDGENEIFLHKKEALQPYRPGDSIDVFIYVDNVGRPTASTKTPFATMEHPNFLEVVNVNVELGIFLHYGMVKDVLLSKDFLPVQMAQWPKPGDRLYVILKAKKDLLFARQVSRKSVAFYLKDPSKLEEGSFVDAFVQFILLEGLVVFTSEGHRNFYSLQQYAKDLPFGRSRQRAGLKTK